MNLLLLSLGVGAVPAFLAAHVPRPARELRIGYINDAAAPYAGFDFVAAEREQLAALGYQLVDLTVGDASAAQVADALDSVDALYVAGGNTFSLLEALRSSGADQLIVERVRAGMPYIGASAGSIVAGPDIEPLSLMDDPSTAPLLTSYDGLGLVTTVVVPHADGKLPQYPIDLSAQIIRQYGATHRLTPVHDDQALLVTPHGERIIASP